MTVYVVPCGVSVFDTLTRYPGPLNRPATGFVERAESLGGALLALPVVDDAAVPRWWAERIADDAEDERLQSWEPRLLCAETNTLTAAGIGAYRDLERHGHTVVLVSSDTGKGVAAALCAAQCVTGPDLPGVTFASTPENLKNASAEGRYVRGPLTVVRLRGLDPTHVHGGFTRAIAGMGHVLRAAFDTGEDVQVHLTGGFRATLLHTLALTEILYSLAPDRVSAHYVYEGAGAASQRVGLRRFDRELLDDMRAELSAVRDGGRHFGAETFGGMAWTEADGLNAFGYGYLAVLGEPLSSGRPRDTG